MDIQIVCNTPDEVLFRNIELNSRRDLPWVKMEDAHDGHAVIVGSGPSLIDCLDSIRWRQALGQKVFALNNAAQQLLAEGIEVDYQVILDARSHNARFVRPAKQHLIASQCDPHVFTACFGQDVRVWHPVIEGIEGHLAKRDEDYALIGGGTTVGLSAMALAYTLGFRKLHLYGYDSSHKEGESHAFPQPENASEPLSKVTVFGRTFSASLAMAWQAELFPALANQLIDLGCTITVDGDGLLPFVVRETARYAAMTEQQKYEAMWAIPDYRKVSPGEHVADTFVSLAGISPDDSVIDFGCGSGRGGQRIVELTGCDMTLFDFAANCLDEWLKKTQSDRFRFVAGDLEEPIQCTADYGFCADVMEHIAPDKVDSVVQNIMRAARRVFFQISTVPDHMGALIGQPLHLTVRPFSWWKDKFEALGYAVQWSFEDDAAALFYVTTHKEI